MRPVTLALCALVSTGAQALETLGSKELVALCQSGSKAEVAVCTAYINGFLDGAFATDPRVAENIVSEMQAEESFSERAIRTRLGNSIDRFGPSYYAGFCIPGDRPMEAILTELRAAAQDESELAREYNARDFLYQLLQKQYPCGNAR